MSTILGPNSVNIIQYGNGVVQNYSASYHVATMTTSMYNSGAATDGPAYHYGSQPIGTYGYFRNMTSTVIQPGGTIAGSSLTYALSYGSAQEVDVSGKGYAYIWRYATGTWRCMGYARYSANPDPISLFLRIS